MWTYIYTPIISDDNATVLTQSATVMWSSCTVHSTGSVCQKCTLLKHALWAESGGWQACISAGVHICTREAWSEAPFGLLQQTSPLSHQHFTSTKPTLPPINHNSICKVHISIYSPSTLHIIQHDITITIILKYNNTTNLKVSQEATEMHQI